MAKHGRPRKDAVPTIPITGEWRDVGEAACERCGVPRTLYAPGMRPELRVCAPCTQVVSTASTPLHRPGDGDILADGILDDDPEDL